MCEKLGTLQKKIHLQLLQLMTKIVQNLSETFYQDCQSQQAGSYFYIPGG